MADSQRKTANLFDITAATSGKYVRDTDGTLGNYEGTSATDYIDVSGINTLYPQYFTDATPVRQWAAFYNSSKTFVSGFSGYNQAITVPNDAAYVRLTVDNNYLNNFTVSSSELDNYEPYGWLHSLRKLTTATDTLTTFPADLYADGTNATVGIKGNMYQASGVSPDNPIQPSETGERTTNLCPMVFSHTGVVDDNGGVATYNTRLWTTKIPVSSSQIYYVAIDGTASNDEILRFNRAIQYDSSGTFISRINTGSNATATFTTDANCAYIVLDIRTISLAVNISDTDINTIQMNEGSQPLPYEPYGYKLDIESASTTTPVYLGEVESTRQIKKIKANELTWTDGTVEGFNFYRASLPVSKMAGGGIATLLSNKYRSVSIRNNLVDGSIAAYNTTTTEVITIRDDRYSSASEWIAANGDTEIWYVLETPETAVVNEPLRKIGTYADTVSGITIPTITGKDTFDVLTSLKPSEVSLAYTGWHDASVGEWDGSEWQ